MNFRRPQVSPQVRRRPRRSLTTEKSTSSSPPLPAGPVSVLSLLLSPPSSAQGPCRVLPEGLKELARCAVEPRFSCFSLSLVHCRRDADGSRRRLGRRTKKHRTFFVCEHYYSPSTFRSTHRPPSPRTEARGSQCATETRREGEINGTSVRKNDLFYSVVAAARSFCSPSFLVVLSLSLEYSLKNQNRFLWSLL